MGHWKKIAPWLGVFLLACLAYTAWTFERMPPVPGLGDVISPADYTDRNNWILLPEETPLPVDVFYLYPTVWGRSNADQAPVCDLDDELMRRGARAVTANQAGPFAMAGNLFAPYYRLLDAAFLLSFSEEERERYVAGVPGHDAEAAFDHYYQHHNQGRPYILVGHSQGAAVIKSLLAGYMKRNPDAYANLVAAYVIGYSVTASDLEKNSHWRFATGADDTGVIVSYNTEAPGATGRNPVVSLGALAINPLSWSRGTEYAPPSLNVGSLWSAGSGAPRLIPGLADAQVDASRGVVVCSSVDPLVYGGSGLFESWSYHFHDIGLYAGNLRDNMLNRARQWYRLHRSLPMPE